MKSSKAPSNHPPYVGIIMGSSSDAAIMSPAREILAEFDVPCEFKVVSAHRTPDEMFRYAETARDRGIEVIIAGAGGSAHLPGMVASKTTLPVIGVPVKTKSLDGLDSLLSIVQMPAGIPVATVAINGAKNAGLLALRMLAATRPPLARKLQHYQKKIRTRVLKSKLPNR